MKSVGLILILSLSACASWQQARVRADCNEQAAEHRGYKEAVSKYPRKPGLKISNTCTNPEYAPQDFVRDYERGYALRLKEVCTLTGAFQLGTDDGKEGDSPNPSVLNACLKSEQSEFLTKYSQGFELGSRSTMISEERMRRRAEEDRLEEERRHHWAEEQRAAQVAPPPHVP